MNEKEASCEVDSDFNMKDMTIKCTEFSLNEIAYRVLRLPNIKSYLEKNKGKHFYQAILECGYFLPYGLIQDVRRIWAEDFDEIMEEMRKEKEIE